MAKSKKVFESVFEKEFLEDLKFWIKTDRKTALRIIDIVEQTIRHPFEGIGKPEPLKYLGTNAWSRRLTQEHRVVYVIKLKRIHFVQCRYHY